MEGEKAEEEKETVSKSGSVSNPSIETRKQLLRPNF